VTKHNVRPSFLATLQQINRVAHEMTCVQIILTQHYRIFYRAIFLKM